MKSRPARDGQLWNREELILAFELYCRIPFQRTKATDTRVKNLAILLDRTPVSVARKLGNFGALDPQLAARNIAGLKHGSKLDKETWDEFHADWSNLVVRAHKLRSKFASLGGKTGASDTPTGPSERVVSKKQRLHQSFFRDAVISSYNGRCCITGIPLQECLVAGHIVPWSVDEGRRADPTNGICLSATFDRLFDSGLVTINDNLTVCVSRSVRNMRDKSAAELVVAYHGREIVHPSRFYPDPTCLCWHRDNIFQAA
jgi:hypothetical protein